MRRIKTNVIIAVLFCVCMILGSIGYVRGREIKKSYTAPDLLLVQGQADYDLCEGIKYDGDRYELSVSNEGAFDINEPGSYQVEYALTPIDELPGESKKQDGKPKETTAAETTVPKETTAAQETSAPETSAAGEVGAAQETSAAETGAPETSAAAETGAAQETSASAETDTAKETSASGGTDTAKETSAAGETDTSKETSASGETDTSKGTSATGETDTSGETSASGETGTSNETSTPGDTDTSKENSTSGDTGAEKADSASGNAGAEKADSASGNAGAEKADSASGNTGAEKADSASGNAGAEKADSSSEQAGSSKENAAPETAMRAAKERIFLMEGVPAVKRSSSSDADLISDQITFSRTIVVKEAVQYQDARYDIDTVTDPFTDMNYDSSHYKLTMLDDDGFNGSRIDEYHIICRLINTDNGKTVADLERYVWITAPGVTFDAPELSLRLNQTGYDLREGITYDGEKYRVTAIDPDSIDTSVEGEQRAIFRMQLRTETDEADEAAPKQASPSTAEESLMQETGEREESSEPEYTGASVVSLISQEEEEEPEANAALGFEEIPVAAVFGRNVKVEAGPVVIIDAPPLEVVRGRGDVDLLAGITAVDEDGDTAPVRIADSGGLPLNKPRKPDPSLLWRMESLQDEPEETVSSAMADGTQLAPGSYTITLEAVHPKTGEIFTATRNINVLVAEEALQVIPPGNISAANPTRAFNTMTEGLAYITADGQAGSYTVSFLKDYTWTTQDRTALQGFTAKAKEVVFSGLPTDTAGGVIEGADKSQLLLGNYNQVTLPANSPISFTMENMVLSANGPVTSAYINAACSPLTMGLGLSSVGNINVYGGSPGDQTRGNTSLTIKSGRYYWVVGGSNSTPHTGNAYITVEGGSIEGLYGSGVMAPGGQADILIKKSGVSVDRVVEFDSLTIADGQSLAPSVIVDGSASPMREGAIKLGAGSTLTLPAAANKAGSLTATGEGSKLILGRRITEPTLTLYGTAAPDTTAGKVTIKYPEGTTGADGDKLISFSGKPALADAKAFIDGIGDGDLFQIRDDAKTGSLYLAASSFRVIPPNVGPDHPAATWDTVGRALSYITADGQAGSYTVSLLKDYSWTPQDWTALQGFTAKAKEVVFSGLPTDTAGAVIEGADKSTLLLGNYTQVKLPANSPISFTMENMVISADGPGTTAYINAMCSPLTMGLGLSSVGDINVYGGSSTGDRTRGNTSLTIKSGRYDWVVGGNNSSPHTGNAYITVEGGNIESLYGAGIMVPGGRADILIKKSGVSVGAVVEFDSLTIADGQSLAPSVLVDGSNSPRGEGAIKLGAGSTLTLPADANKAGSLTATGEGSKLILGRRITAPTLTLYGTAALDTTAGKVTIKYPEGTTGAGGDKLLYFSAKPALADAKAFIDGIGDGDLLRIRDDAQTGSVYLAASSFRVIPPNVGQDHPAVSWDTVGRALSYITADGQEGSYTVSILNNYTWTPQDVVDLQSFTAKAQEVVFSGLPTDPAGAVIEGAAKSTLTFASGMQVYLPVNSPISFTMENMTLSAFNASYSVFINAQCSPLTMGRGLSSVGYINVYGGGYYGVSGNTSLTIESGNYNTVMAGNSTPAQTGNAYVTVGGGDITYLYGGAATTVGGRAEILIKKSGSNVKCVYGFDSLTVADGQTFAPRTLVDGSYFRTGAQGVIKLGAGSTLTVPAAANKAGSLTATGEGSKLILGRRITDPSLTLYGTAALDTTAGKVTIKYPEGTTGASGDKLISFSAKPELADTKAFIDGIGDGNMFRIQADSKTGSLYLADSPFRVIPPNAGPDHPIITWDTVGRALSYITTDGQEGIYTFSILKNYTWTAQDVTDLQNFTAKAKGVVFSGQPTDPAGAVIEGAAKSTLTFSSGTQVNLPANSAIAFTMENMTFSGSYFGAYVYINAQCSPLTMGQGLSTVGAVINVYGGGYNAALKGDANLTIESGSYNDVVAGSYAQELIGNAYVTVEGGSITNLSGSLYTAAVVFRVEYKKGELRTLTSP